MLEGARVKSGESVNGFYTMLAVMKTLRLFSIADPLNYSQRSIMALFVEAVTH